MKKQLIATAVALVLSSTAFAATEGQHTINLNVAPNPPTLTLNGAVIAGTTNINFDNLNVNNGTNIVQPMGNIAISATDYPLSYSGTCEIAATSTNEWKLIASGNPAEIKYQIKAVATSLPFGVSGSLSNFRLEYGYATQVASLVEHPLVTPLVQANPTATTKSCSFDFPMDLIIGGLTRPAVTEFTTFTDTINFVASVI